MPEVVRISLASSQHPEVPPLLQHYLFPLPLKSHALRPLRCPIALRGTRAVFVLLKKFFSKLETEAEVILTLLVKLISVETDAGEAE